MNMEQLEAGLKTLEDKVARAEDIEEIKKLPLTEESKKKILYSNAAKILGI